VKTGRGVRRGCCLSQIVFSEYLTNAAVEGFGDFTLVIRTVKYADDLELLAKEETSHVTQCVTCGHVTHWVTCPHVLFLSKSSVC
jgi:hypothetical protein